VGWASRINRKQAQLLLNRVTTPRRAIPSKRKSSLRSQREQKKPEKREGGDEEAILLWKTHARSRLRKVPRANRAHKADPPERDQNLIFRGKETFGTKKKDHWGHFVTKKPRQGPRPSRGSGIIRRRKNKRKRKTGKKKS